MTQVHTRRVGLLLDPVFERHHTGVSHPERAERLVRIRQVLEQRGLTARCLRIEPCKAGAEVLKTVHVPEYLDRLERACRSGRAFIDNPDSAICPDSFEVAQTAAGGVLRATDMVAEGELDAAFCAVRPPGHHAEADISMGFCLLNNVALAASRLRTHHGIERLAILDWDVHHGNGTQHIFEQDGTVLYVSLHQSPETLYPGTGYAEETGRGAGLGATVNIPLGPGTADEEYLDAFERIALPALAGFAPEFILISAGFDGHAADPLASLALSEEAYGTLTVKTRELAEQFSQGRMVSVLEGGYDLAALADSVSTHLRVLLEEDPAAL